MAVVRRRSALPQAPSYRLADVQKLSDAHGEPAWLRARRMEAWEIYQRTPMPYLEEEWRRTDYRHIRWAEAERMIQPNGATSALVPAKNLEPLTGDEQGGLLVFVNGKLVRSELADSLVAQGVIFTDLRAALRDHEALVKERLMTQAVQAGDGKFAALHAALWSYGVFVHVPRNSTADLPLHVVCYNSAAGTAMGHVLVVLEDNAQATMQVEYASADGSEHSAYIGATELIVGAGGNLRYVSLQDWNRETFEFSHQRGVVGRDAQLDWVNGVMGSRLTKAFIEVDAVGAGANARVSGFFFADRGQFFDLDTQQNHNAPLTNTDLLFKGAARDNARTLWQGMIKSLPQMQRIDGYQVCRNLLLSDEARMDSIPGLEIEADDVACSHAATFGTLEEEPIYYLMSRGITRPQAQLMIIEGFFDELLQRVPFERVRQRLMDEIEAKIIG
ncbi:MAG: Fe-S cluster assembly protein SufD [Chloroflexota bacterium]|nr:Fe-S cluster assembly protein SufD [Chloroflexota bacterium]MDE2946389.1 Fe-S cluster assembly protein SufD [Chloroflexota bacterium]